MRTKLLNGWTTKEVADFYGIGVQAVRSNIENLEKHERLIAENDVYRLLNRAARYSAVANRTVAARAFNILKRRGVNTRKDLLNVSCIEASGWRNVGIFTIALIALAKELAEQELKISEVTSAMLKEKKEERRKAVSGDAE